MNHSVTVHRVQKKVDSTTGEMEEEKKLLARSHAEVLEKIKGFSNEELFLSKAFPAVGGSVLGSYFVSATSSHYDWAIRKIKAHQKNCK